MNGMSIREIAQRRGPFVSLYFDATHDTEDAAKQQELRWRSIREQLIDQGATEPMLALLDDAVTGSAPEPGRAGRALIADATQILVDQRLPHPPAREIVRVSPLPYLLPLIEYETQEVPHVVAMVDRTGSELYGVDDHGEVVGETVEGAEHPIHKVRHGGGWSHRSMQRRAEETARRNIDEVAEELTRLARRIAAQVIVLAGEVGARSALRKALGAAEARIEEVEVGGRAAGTDSGELDHRVHDIVAEEARRRRDEVVQRFATERGRDDGLAVTGLPETTSALLAANADSLLINSSALGDRTVRIAPEPIQDPAAPFPAAGAETRDCRADEALPVAALVRGGTILPVDDELATADGVGALLRHG
ncbi:hypothetical protein B0T44_14620 [Nocardia donostiensis]|uniref:Peptide chain release factor 2 n=2 Tax=Nocardia donostiensis TaxID=1538463 RepID=A0A1V2TKM9_9NOCA|nr:hypothetical protein B0T46_02885 [Nocardia donostiensis]OQS19425.1 hypothetical protein B0T44_14620 [Nocardia donostiensis]